MKLNTLKNTITIFALAFVMMLGASGFAGAQTDRKAQREQQKIDKQQRKVWERQAKLEDRNIKLNQRREQIRLRNMRKNRTENAETNRYRISRDGTYYQTDNRGVELLKQAVNTGYQEGYRAGRNDRNSRRTSSFANSVVYRKGNYGYQSYVESGQYQYYFKQGFERGYEDGFNSRYENGRNDNGTINILGNILENILTVEKY
jgi:flagellar biosynthesis/type III secretory pathway protein FliH